MNVQTALLDAQALVELYYSVYNPDMAESQKISDVGKLRIE